MRGWIIVLALVVLSSATWAQDDWDGWTSAFQEPADETLWLRGVESIQILTNDGVTGGCWTNAGAVKDAIELSLRRAGIKVVDDFTATHILWLHVSGASDGRGGCFGLHSLRFYEFRSANLLVPGATGAVAFIPLDCSTSSVGSSMNESVRSRAIEQSDALALRILRARDAE